MSKVILDLGYYSVFGVNLLCMEKQINMQSVSDGSCTVHPELAAALLRDIVLPTSAIVVPDAPVSALKEVAQLLHLGRYFVIRGFEYRNLQCLYAAEDNLSNQLQGLARVSAESAKSG